MDALDRASPRATPRARARPAPRPRRRPRSAAARRARGRSRTAPRRAGRAAACWRSRRPCRRASPQQVLARRLDPADQLDQQVRPRRGSPRSRRACASARREITGRRPLKRSISPARSSSSCANAEPTVPWPSSPTLEAAGSPRAASDIACGQILEALAPDDDARVAVGGRRSRAGGARRCSCCAIAKPYAPVAGVTITSPGRGSASSASRTITSPDSQCLPASTHARRAVEAVGDVRFVGGAVEHRAQVVGHAAVDRDPARDVALDALDRVQRHARVRAQRAPRLDQQAPRRRRRCTFACDRRHERAHVLLDRGRRGLLGGVLHAQAAAEVPHGEVAERGELGDLALERLAARAAASRCARARPASVSPALRAQRARSPRAPRPSGSRTSSRPGRSRSSRASRRARRA